MLTILGVLMAGLSLSLAGRDDSAALRSAAKDLAAAVRYAAAQARLHQMPHRVAFYEEAAEYRVEIADARSAEGFSPVAGQAGRKHVLTHGVRVIGVIETGGQMIPVPRVIEYTPQGMGFSGTIHLANRKDETLVIEVIAQTGQTYVMR